MRDRLVSEFTGDEFKMILMAHQTIGGSVREREILGTTQNSFRVFPPCLESLETSGVSFHLHFVGVEVVQNVPGVSPYAAEQFIRWGWRGAENPHRFIESELHGRERHVQSCGNLLMRQNIFIVEPEYGLEVRREREDIDRWKHERPVSEDEGIIQSE